MSSTIISQPVSLDSTKRKAVEQAIREVCDYRKWLLRAINVRTNHVYLVVSIGNESPSKALNNFKAYATRKMREKIAGRISIVRGRTEAVSDIFGMKEASKSPSIML